MSIKYPMKTVGVGYISGPSENQILPYVGQDNLFGALEVKLDYINLIRNISPMWQNMEVHPTSMYSLEMALQVYIRNRSC